MSAKLEKGYDKENMKWSVNKNISSKQNQNNKLARSSADKKRARDKEKYYSDTDIAGISTDANYFDRHFIISTRKNIIKENEIDS